MTKEYAIELILDMLWCTGYDDERYLQHQRVKLHTDNKYFYDLVRDEIDIHKYL